MATLSYAYAESVVWLEELAAEAHPMIHDLCHTHASNVRVPRGWELRDRWAQMDEEVTGVAVPVHDTVGRLDLVGA